MTNKTYKILRLTRQLFFVCLECGHRVDVNAFRLVPFGSAKRTQAAAAMQAHQLTHKIDPIKASR
jgi:hypothetical protein